MFVYCECLVSVRVAFVCADQLKGDQALKCIPLEQPTRDGFLPQVASTFGDINNTHSNLRVDVPTPSTNTPRRVPTPRANVAPRVPTPRTNTATNMPTLSTNTATNMPTPSTSTTINMPRLSINTGMDPLSTSTNAINETPTPRATRRGPGGRGALSPEQPAPTPAVEPTPTAPLRERSTSDKHSDRQLRSQHLDKPTHGDHHVQPPPHPGVGIPRARHETNHTPVPDETQIPRATTTSAAPNRSSAQTPRAVSTAWTIDMSPPRRHRGGWENDARPPSRSHRHDKQSSRRIEHEPHTLTPKHRHNSNQRLLEGAHASQQVVSTGHSPRRADRDMVSGLVQSPFARAYRRQTPREAEGAGRDTVIDPKSQSASTHTPRGRKIPDTARIHSQQSGRVSSKQTAHHVQRDAYSENSARSHAVHARAVTNDQHPHSRAQQKTEHNMKERGHMTNRRSGDRSHDTHNAMPTPQQRATAPFEEATKAVHRSFEPFRIRREPQVKKQCKPKYTRQHVHMPA